MDRQKTSNVAATAPARAGPPGIAKRSLLPAAIVLSLAIVLCSVYANLAFAVTDPSWYRFFPPFQANVHVAQSNRQLGAEYFNIATALTQGRGFADPFGERTGPTAWMPPILSLIEAGLLLLCDGSRNAVAAIVVCLQVAALIVTGWLVLALVRRTTIRVGPNLAALVFFVALLGDFHQCFQSTHDAWLVLLAVDGVIAGLCWWRPLGSRWRAAGWGLAGGLCALINPIVGFAWAILSLVIAHRQRVWPRFGMALLAAGLAVTPWTIRNLVVFGRLIPIKSNAAYELYQSQCIQADGLMQHTIFVTHPFCATGVEGRAYRQLGETAYLDQKRAQFLEALAADPVEFLDRVASRFLGATVWYVPFDRIREPRQRPWVFWYARLTHPLPFLALLVLLLTAFRQPLGPTQWAVIGMYLLYLLPYIFLSYYERYTTPLLGTNALLVVWAMDQLWLMMRGGAILSVRRRRLLQWFVIASSIPDTAQPSSHRAAPPSRPAPPAAAGSPQAGGR